MVPISSTEPQRLTSIPGASMTLVGLLPPLCDNGNMLVDGGYGTLWRPYTENFADGSLL